MLMLNRQQFRSPQHNHCCSPKRNTARAIHIHPHTWQAATQSLRMSERYTAVKGPR
jgi:hypothetical protein